MTLITHGFLQLSFASIAWALSRLTVRESNLNILLRIVSIVIAFSALAMFYINWAVNGEWFIPVVMTIIATIITRHKIFSTNNKTSHHPGNNKNETGQFTNLNNNFHHPEQNYLKYQNHPENDF